MTAYSELLGLIKTIDSLLCLSDRIYDVRDDELKGWEGPKVKAYSEAVTKLQAIIDADVQSKNQDLLSSFSDFCQAHPELRFWQALRGWAEVNFILVSAAKDFQDVPNSLRDTFYWEGRDK